MAIPYQVKLLIGNHDEKFLFKNEIPNNFILLDELSSPYSFSNVNFYASKHEMNLNREQDNILLLHGNIDTIGDNDYININKYIPLGFDYIALGHIHEYKEYKRDNLLMAYPGSLFSNGFDECGNKGYIEFEIESHTIKNFAFKPLQMRKFMICKCDITNLKNSWEILNKIESTLKSFNIEKRDLVRLILEGKIEEDTDKSLTLINEKFSDYFYFEIEDKTRFEVNIEKIKKEKLSFKYEYIRLIEESDLDEETKNTLYQLGIEALKGEEFSLWR